MSDSGRIPGPVCWPRGERQVWVLQALAHSLALGEKREPRGGRRRRRI